MKCPFCGHNEDRVLDTREQNTGEAIRRRRECLSCKARFSTLEVIQLAFPFVIKKDGRREPYNKDKILRGIQAACQKRPISRDQLDAAVDRISAWVIGRGEKEVPASLIGQKLMAELRILDDVAYVRFASVYRQFKDVQEFMETLEDQAKFEGFDPESQLALQPAKEDTDATPIQRTCPTDTFSN